MGDFSIHSAVVHLFRSRLLFGARLQHSRLNLIVKNAGFSTCVFKIGDDVFSVMLTAGCNSCHAIDVVVFKTEWKNDWF